MANIFSSMTNFTSITSTLVKRGIGGISTWDSALAKSAASDLARETNAKIADGESKKLAFNVRKTADEVIKDLTVAVNTANQSFRESMDNIFIFKGLWSRSSNGYVKDIIKGSTLFTPVISETVFISGYRNYILEPVKLKTNLDESSLAGLNTIAIQGLINNVYSEVQTIAGEIFGNGEDIIKINKSGIKREQSPGKFGAHIGYSPAEKQSEKAVTSRKEMFHDEGAGELGRLISDFQYWLIIDKMGSAELTLAPWDKRMWNDEGSWFTSPSLRTVGTIAGSIVAGIATAGVGGIAGIALSVGISSASDIAFGALDVSFGYKSFDEAAFNVGKSILTNTITSTAGGLFNGMKFADKSDFKGLTNIGVDKAANAFDKVLTKTLLTGTQTLTTGIATSLVSGITYNGGEFGFSKDIFNASMKGVFTSSLTSMTSTFTTTGLTAINSGLDYNKIEGFNRLNKADLQNLNGLIGSLAGQGINYALGNDFTLNVLNLSLLTGDKNYSSGLLELHLGHDGVNMNFGTGGSNISIDNLISVYRGAQVWNLNTKISKYGKENDFDALITLRAQYGYGDNVQKNQLWDILNGNVLIDTKVEGDYFAETTINEDGKRVINLAAYEKGMSDEDQFLLAMVLGHEAYRDGYITGEIDSYGNLVTNESQVNEFRSASIARVLMGDRIQEEHKWFYNVFEGAALESLLLGLPKDADDLSLFYDYLELNYNNDRDYLLLSTDTKGDLQTAYKDTLLFNSPSKEIVDAINEERKRNAYKKYAAPNFSYEKYNSCQDYLNSPEYLQYEAGFEIGFAEFKKDIKLMEANDYEEVKLSTISSVGCMFMSTKYGLEAILGEEIDTITLHNYIKSNKLFNGDNLLSNERMAEIMTKYIKEKKNGDYTVEYVKNFGNSPTTDTLNIINSSEEKYLIHLRIQNPSNPLDYTHSVMVKSIDYTKNEENNITGISKVHVANPLPLTSHFNTKSEYLPNAIDRWDFFLVTDNRPKL